jgi:hypothetical protein
LPGKRLIFAGTIKKGNEKPNPKAYSFPFLLIGDTFPQNMDAVGRNCYNDRIKKILFIKTKFLYGYITFCSQES